MERMIVATAIATGLEGKDAGARLTSCNKFIVVKKFKPSKTESNAVAENAPVSTF